MQKELENGSFTLLENGKEIEYTTLLTFYNEDFNKHYVVYTDNTTSEDGNLNTFASTYNPMGDDFELYPIETEEEWDNIEQVLNENGFGGEINE